MAIEFLGLAAALVSLGIGSVLAVKFRLPPLIMFLVAGIFVGSSNLLQQNATITFLGDLGSIMLLFVIGTEFSIYKLLGRGFRDGFLIAALEIIITFLLLYFAFSLKFDPVTSMVLALIFSITSTAISLKLLSELNLGLKFNLPMIIKISIVEDLIGVLLLSVINSISEVAGSSIISAVESFGISIALFIAAYLAFYIFSTRIIYRYNIDEPNLMLFAMCILLLLVSIAGILGISTSFAAYTAGSIVSVWKGKWPSLKKDFEIFSYIFISFFFFSIGLQVNLGLIDFALLALLFVLVVIVKFVGLFSGTYAVSRSLKTSVYTSIAMMPRGELSLVIVSAAVSSSLLPPVFLGLTSMIVVLTTLLSFIMLRNSERIYQFIYSRMWRRGPLGS